MITISNALHMFDLFRDIFYKVLEITFCTFMHFLATSWHIIGWSDIILPYDTVGSRYGSSSRQEQAGPKI